MKPKVIGIIGGKGKMGKLFTNAFKKEKYEVLSYDLDTNISPKDFAKICDVLIFSVPIRETKKIMQQFLPFVKEDSLVTDFTSIKTPVCQVMKNSKAEDIIGGHPLFGPTVDLKGQNFILTPVKKNNYYLWYKEILKSFGLNVIEMSPEKHDKNMAVIQCLTHLSNITLGYALRKLDFNFKDAEEISSPVYLMRIFGAGRILAQNSQLYSDIQMENPYAKEVAQIYLESTKELEKTIVEKDKEKFEDIFEKSQEYFGEYLESSMKYTDQMIKVLSNLNKKSN